jgi:hypothetical protein
MKYLRSKKSSIPEDKPLDFKPHADSDVESTPLDEFDFANDGEFKTANRKILSKWAEDFSKK